MAVFIIIATIVDWIFITVHVYPKGLVVWVCKTNGEFEWNKNRLLGGTTDVCECLFFRTRDNQTVLPLFIRVYRLGVWMFRAPQIRMFVTTLS